MIIRNGRLVNRGRITEGDVWIKNGRIEKIGAELPNPGALPELDARGHIVMPGIIDDQVHFREPGLTHKADIYSESRAAVAGGVTSFMEMPNVQPPSVTLELLEDKYQIGAQHALANYSFYLGATNDNVEVVKRADPKRICGVKIFMGSSTGNMLVDNNAALEQIFAHSPMLIATHCEDESTVRRRMKQYEARYGDQLAAKHHPLIRNVEACYLSSSLAVSLAKKYGARLHVLHITTEKELELFDNTLPLAQKKITAEVCVHHLQLHSGDYKRYGNLIKCNPAIKSRSNRDALLPALLDDRLDVVATDHAPHTWAEKSKPYAEAPSGLPLIQHTLNLMLDLYHAGRIGIERIVEKMCHAPAIAYQIQDRGFLEEGQWADIAIVDVNARWIIGPENILYKCGWSPFTGQRMWGKVISTIVSGHLAWHEGRFDESKMGERLAFER